MEDIENIDTPTAAPAPLSYVTFDPETGELLGGFLQVVLSEHDDCHIEVSDDQRIHWPMYRANAARDGLELLPPAPPAPPAVPDYVAEVQRMLDEKAQERRYDNILSACTYATSTQPAFQAEGQACVAWRDAVWAKCYELMGQVESGELAQPAIDELLGMLPQMEWPT